MKVDFPSYDRFGLSNTNQSPVSNTKSNRIDQTHNVIQKVDQAANTKSVGLETNVTENINSNFNPKTNLSKLSDILTKQESDMLRSLFPTKGSGWGVAAYDNYAGTVELTGKGMNINLKT